jgi:hypothetical protein
MSERPEAADLLEEARRTLLEVLLPLLPQDRRYDGLMVANAMAIAGREARQGDELLRDAVANLAGLLGAGGPSQDLRAMLQDLERRLVFELRRGAYDDPGRRREAVRAYLRASTERRLRVSNPKALVRS